MNNMKIGKTGVVIAALDSLGMNTEGSVGNSTDNTQELPDSNTQNIGEGEDSFEGADVGIEEGFDGADYDSEDGFEGEDSFDGIEGDGSLDASVSVENEGIEDGEIDNDMMLDSEFGDNYFGEGDYHEEMGMNPDFDMGGEVKDPLLSSWIFVSSITVVVLAVGIALGVFGAKRKIKKGIELYED